MKLIKRLKNFFFGEKYIIPDYDNSDDIAADNRMTLSQKKEAIAKILLKLNISNATILDDLSVNILILSISDIKMDYFPVKINECTSVSISNCGLKSLKNLPKECGYLRLVDNKIESLEFCPISRSMDFSNNSLKSLEFLPLEKLDFLNIENNYITDISIFNQENIIDFLCIANNKISNLYEIQLNNHYSFYYGDNPIQKITQSIFGYSYPDNYVIDAFNSFNIILDDGDEKPKLFTDNLLKYIKSSSIYEYSNNSRYERLLSDFRESYELTTMLEYYKQ